MILQTLSTKGQFRFIANNKNPLGLLKVNSTVFQVVGWYTHFNSKETMCRLNGTLPNSNLAFNFQFFGSNNGGCWDYMHIEDHEYKVSEELKHFKLNVEDYFCFRSPFNTVFVFKVYQEPISIMTQITKKPEQAIWDFCNHNKIIPEIMSENRIVEEIARAVTDNTKKSNYHKNLMDIEALRSVFYMHSTETKNSLNYVKKETTFEELEKEELRKIKEEPELVLFSDYDLNLKELHKKINQQAKLKGGFLDFEYKNKIYKIPKLPLLAWAYQDSINRSKYTIHNETWYPLSHDGIKTSEDNVFHSDWWIGAGFPISCYNLQHDGYRYIPFNNAVSDFAFSCIGKNTLDDIIVLSGHDLPDVKGNIIVNPQTLDDFNEDDIIILSHGGVEFDLFMKKACKNGKGAVILEIGNKVSHLAIVSRELGYRLLLIPNAMKLLVNNVSCTVSTQQHKIII